MEAPPETAADVDIVEREYLVAIGRAERRRDDQAAFELSSALREYREMFKA